MKKVLVFGGTSETRTLLNALIELRCAVTVCVASEYGKTLLAEAGPILTVLVGRLDAGQIEALIIDGGYPLIVDATHPYATEVTKNIQSAVSKTGVSYFRLVRESSDLNGAAVVSSAAQAAEYLKAVTGNVLLTTGSKDLAAYTVIPDYAERLYPRVLPAADSIEACLGLGFSASHIIAVQGPFSKELNIALMRHFDIKTLVTKDGGKRGGFPEKLEAARTFGAELVVIGRPNEDGLSQPQIIRALKTLLEAESCV